MTDNKKLSAEEYIAGREGLREDKITMLRYLEKVSDVFWIDLKPKGNSIAVCEFDCGAYKGSEILRFNIKTINPLMVALSLSKLTSGHHFNFLSAEAAALQQMEQNNEPTN